MPGALFRRMSLNSKAALLIAVILVVVMSVSTVTITRGVIPRLERSFLRSSTLVSKNLIAEIKKTIDLGVPIAELEGLSLKLDLVIEQYPDHGYLYVADTDGAVLYQSKGTTAEMLKAAKGKQRKSDEGEVRELTVQSATFFDIALPIVSNNVTEGSVHLGLRKEVVDAQSVPLFRQLIIIGFVSFLLATVLITLFVRRLISRPLEGLSAFAERISQGELAAPAETARRDEIGQLATGFGVMVKGLSAVISRSKETSDDLKLSAKELSTISISLDQAYSSQLSTLEMVSGSVGKMEKVFLMLSERAAHLLSSSSETSSTIVEMVGSIREINANMKEINRSVEEIASAIRETSATVKQVAEGADQTATMAEETRDAIGRIDGGIRNIQSLAEKSRAITGTLRSNASDVGSRAVKETIAGIHSIQKDVDALKQAMKNLLGRVAKIGEIVIFIDAVADQTNLLALNASIISAQAGEHGKGFGVVASEIRELANRTTASTKQIADLIKAVQGEVASFGQSLQRVSGSVDTGIHLGSEAEKALNLIIGSVDESAEMSALIAGVTKEQAQASEKLSASVRIFSARAEEIKRASSEEARGTELIREAMEKVHDMIVNVYRATEDQDKGSDLIAKIAEESRSIAESLSGSAKEEKALIDNVLSAILSLKGIAEENSRLVKDVATAAELLSDRSVALTKELGGFRVTKRAAPENEA